MFSIKFDKDKSIVLIFDKTCTELKNKVIDIVVNSFDKPMYFAFEFCGISAEEIVKDFKSNKNILILDNKHRLLKELPQSYIMSEYMEDVEVFKENIGNFNEGNMFLYVLKNNISNKFISITYKKEINKLIETHTLLFIEVGDDGDSLKIYCNDSEKLVYLNSIIRLLVSRK